MKTGIPWIASADLKLLQLMTVEILLSKLHFVNSKLHRAETNLYVNTTKGNPNVVKWELDQTQFSILDSDPYLEDTAWYYEFKLLKYSYPGNVLISSTDWITTSDYPRLISISSPNIPLLLFPAILMPVVHKHLHRNPGQSL